MPIDYVLKKTGSSALPSLDYRGELNEAQYEAVTAKPGPILVIAGAGSGKTRTLTYRVAYLVENGVEPENILLLTFTNKAAKEMLERVGNLLPQNTSRLWGGTFHSVANRLLRRHAPVLGFGSDFTILDRDDAEALAQASIKGAGWDGKDKTLPKAGVVLDVLGLAGNTGKTIRAVLEENYPYFSQASERISEVHRLYQERKKENNLMDYDDLLLYALELLTHHPDLCERYQHQFQHVLVDEYQDTNQIQADFIDALARFHQQLMAVGDDAQSIYSWRGANVANILNLEKRYPGLRRIPIETNYRSTPEILSLANVVLADNVQQYGKNLQAARPESRHPKPALVCLNDANQQAAFICQRIGELHDEGIELNEIAILYRAHFHSMEIQMELTRQNIPFDLISGLRFFEQAHVKDVAAFLKFALNPKDEMAFKRISKLMPGVGERTADKIWTLLMKGSAPLGEIDVPAKSKAAWTQFVETHQQLLSPHLENRASEQIQIVIDAIYQDYMRAKFTNFQSRLEDLGQLRAFAANFAQMEDFLAQLALMTTGEGRSPLKIRNRGAECPVEHDSSGQGLGMESRLRGHAL